MIKTRFIQVPDWDKYHPWPNISALRNLIFNKKENGLGKSGAIKKIGKVVLIDEVKFFKWVSSHKG